MAEIIITEFIDQSAVDDLATDYDVVYDPALVDQPDRLLDLIGKASALIVRGGSQGRRTTGSWARQYRHGSLCSARDCRLPSNRREQRFSRGIRYHHHDDTSAQPRL